MISEQIYRFANCEVNRALRQVRVNGVVGEPQPKALDLLLYLIENRDRVVDKDELLGKLWPGVVVSESALTQALRKARAMVGDDGERQAVIRTVQRRGFRFVAQLDDNSARPASPATPAMSAASTGSVAVLPFTDMSPAHDQGYFCDGIAEEIITSLCFIRGLRIASRTSSFQFKDRSADVRDIGRQLGVGAVLEGSVRKAGDRLRITAQLISFTDGFQLWSETYDRKLEDAFAIQTDIAQRLVVALRGSLSPRETQVLERGGTRNAEAYDLFLRGQQSLRGYSIGTEAAALFRRAIQHDGEFAQAHAGLASALGVKGIWRVDMTPAEFEEAFEASRRALALEPWMPEAFLARACLMSMQGRADDAVRDFEEAIRLNPTSYYSYYVYGRHCMVGGLLEKAVELFREAARLEPDEYTPLGMLAATLQWLGRKEEFTRVARRAMGAIERHLQSNPSDEAALARGAVCAAWLGDTVRAVELAERAASVQPDGFAGTYNAACAYAVMGNGERAMALLDQAVGDGRGNLSWIENDRDFEAFRGDPRFEAIVNRVRVASGASSA